MASDRSETLLFRLEAAPPQACAAITSSSACPEQQSRTSHTVMRIYCIQQCVRPVRCKCVSVQTCRCKRDDVQMRQCANASMRKRDNVQTRQCANTSVCKCVNAQTRQCVNTSMQRCQCANTSMQKRQRRGHCARDIEDVRASTAPLHGCCSTLQIGVVQVRQYGRHTLRDTHLVCVCHFELCAEAP